MSIVHQTIPSGASLADQGAPTSLPPPDAQRAIVLDLLEPGIDTVAILREHKLTVQQLEAITRSPLATEAVRALEAVSDFRARASAARIRDRAIHILECITFSEEASPETARKAAAMLLRFSLNEVPAAPDAGSSSPLDRIGNRHEIDPRRTPSKPKTELSSRRQPRQAGADRIAPPPARARPSRQIHAEQNRIPTPPGLSRSSPTTQPPARAHPPAEAPPRFRSPRLRDRETLSNHPINKVVTLCIRFP